MLRSIMYPCIHSLITPSLATGSFYLGVTAGSETPAIIILSYIRSSARFMIISGRCHLMRLSFTFLLSDTGWGWTAESSM